MSSTTVARQGVWRDLAFAVVLGFRGIEKVALHADLCILATLASALARARPVPLAA